VQIPPLRRTPPKSAGRGARILFQQAETKLRQLRCRSPVPLSAELGACAPRTIPPPAALAQRWVKIEVRESRAPI